MNRIILISLFCFPIAWGAFAVNVFFASLIGSWIGLPVLGTLWSILLGGLIAIPTTWLFARHIDRLMKKADGETIV